MPFISAPTPSPRSPCQMYRGDMQQIKGEASLHHRHLKLGRQDISRGDLYNAVTVSSKCTFVMPLFMTAAPQLLVLDAGVTWGEVSRYNWVEWPRWCWPVSAPYCARAARDPWAEMNILSVKVRNLDLYLRRLWVITMIIINLCGWLGLVRCGAGTGAVCGPARHLYTAWSLLASVWCSR